MTVEIVALGLSAAALGYALWALHYAREIHERVARDLDAQIDALNEAYVAAVARPDDPATPGDVERFLEPFQTVQPPKRKTPANPPAGSDG